MTREATPSALVADANHDPLAHGRLRVDTPEQVAFELPLAGLGSRFAALVLDLVAIAVVVAAGLFVVHVTVGFRSELGITVATILATVVFWAWFFVFEAFGDGATPGKRIAGLRVVQEGGEALTPLAAALRNLLRIVDMQPGVTGLVGGTVMLFHPRAKRLGDLVAGTVVVRDLPAEFPPLAATSDAVGPPRLGEAEFGALERFLARHASLDAASRRRLTKSHLAAIGLATGSLEDLAAFHAEERVRRAASHVAARTGAASLVRARQRRWQGFQRTVDRLRPRKFRGLADEEAADFAAAFRAVSTDLARARTLGVGASTRWALERLVARAHGRFHTPVREGRGRFFGFVRSGFPRAVRRHRLAVAAGLLALYGSALVVHVLVTRDPTLEPVVLPVEMERRADVAAADPSLDYRDTFGAVWVGSGFLAGYVLVNNVQVAFVTFAAGVFAGLGSLALLLLNGAMLGAAFAAFANRGAGSNLLAWVAPHGPFELTAIAVAGAAGFVVGSALWMPGRATRARALQERGREGLRAFGGAVLLLVAAAPLEGFAAPARVDPAVKYAIGLACTVLLVLYFTVAGKDERAVRK